jgi:hypothetical protein
VTDGGGAASFAAVGGKAGCGSFSARDATAVKKARMTAKPTNKPMKQRFARMRPPVLVERPPVSAPE